MEDKRLKRFTRLLTVPLAGAAGPPVRIESYAGRGLHILLHSDAGGLLHVFLTPAAAVEEAFVRTRITSMRYMGGRSPTDQERIWLDLIASALDRVERQAGWGDFLEWAMQQPAVALPSGYQPDERITSGDAALIRINTNCNARCDFCCAKGVLPDLVEDSGQIRQRVASGVRAGASLVSFSGGEPTLRKDLPDLIRMARDEGAPGVDVQTNGILLARAGWARRLAEAGMSSIFLSLHSSDEAVHDKMLRVDGAFRKAVKAVELCLEAGVEVRFNCVLTTLNLGGVVDFVKFVAGRFKTQGAHVCLSFVALQGWALEHPELVPRLARAAPGMAAALDAGLDLGLDVRVPGLCGVPICVLPGYEERFDEFHDPNPPPRLPTRSWVAVCEGCTYRQRCSGFWTAYLDRFGGGELGQGASPLVK